MDILMLCGYAGSGKDATFRAIKKFLPEAERFAFADALKEELASAFGVTKVEIERRKPEFRELLQAWGEGRRKIISPDYWIDQVITQIVVRRPELAVITDTRLPEEVSAIQEAFPYPENRFIDVWVSRPGVGPVNNHRTETALEDYQFNGYILNNGTISELEDVRKRHAARLSRLIFSFKQSNPGR